MLPGDSGPKKIAPFASPRNGLASVRLGKDSCRVYYVDAYGGIIELALEGGHVRSRNLTTEMGAPVAGAISPLAVTEPGNLAVRLPGSRTIGSVDAVCPGKPYENEQAYFRDKERREDARFDFAYFRATQAETSTRIESIYPGPAGAGAPDPPALACRPPRHR